VQALTIGQVADQAGVGVETVRFYQRKGLIIQPPRKGTRHRRYSADTVARIRFIRGAQNLGFSLKEIEELLALRVVPGASKSDVRERAQAKVVEIEEKMRDLQRMKDTLMRLIGACDGAGPLEDCPILDAFDQGTGAPVPSRAETQS
jgi:MerR family copper efflux transcriptional regulator